MKLFAQQQRQQPDIDPHFHDLRTNLRGIDPACRNPNTDIQTQKYRNRNTNTEVEAQKSKYRNTNTEIQMQKYKYRNTKTEIQTSDIDPHFHDLRTNLRAIDPACYQMCTLLKDWCLQAGKNELGSFFMRSLLVFKFEFNEVFF